MSPPPYPPPLAGEGRVGAMAKSGTTASAPLPLVGRGRGVFRCAAHQFIRVWRFASEDRDSAKRSHSEAVCDSNSVRWRTHRTIFCECGKSATNCLNLRGALLTVG